MTDQSDIEMLMSKAALEMTRKDLDAIIQHHRNIRAMREAGTRGAKPKKDVGPATKIDLAALGLKQVKPTMTIKRRI